MNREKDVLVFLEAAGENGGTVNRGLLAEGRRIARLLDGNLRAVVVGTLVEGTRFLDEYGVSSLYHVDGKDLSPYSCEVFAWAAQAALRTVSFRLLLFAHSDRGSELAPRIATFLGTSAVALCNDVRVRGKALSYVKVVQGGQFEQEVSYAGPFPEIVTIATDSLDSRQGVTGDMGAVPGQLKMPLQIVNVPVEVPPDVVRTRSLQLIPPDFKTVDILHAERIVGVGSGCGDLSRAEELSHLLEASIGTTRPVVDDGHIPKKRMIGQTGKTVSPELYLALGISGSPHHVAGIQQSREILSVNLDPRAPIFNFSDAGFVADLEGLLPKLIDRIERYRDEGPP